MAAVIELVVTDLDGTLLDSRSELSPIDRRTLHELGERGITRVVATGRSLFSARRVLAPDFPIDYLAHTSGAGIVRWQGALDLCAHRLSPRRAESLAAELVARGLDFMLHQAIPDEHAFYAHRASALNPDFEARVRLYAAHARPLPVPFVAAAAMGHVVVIEPQHREDLFTELIAAFSDCQIVRTTSPLDGTSAWMEIYPAGVGKGRAAEWIRAREGASEVRSVAIGNDYNDLELLEWAGRSFVVANAPAELCARYETVASNDEAGFTEAVRRAFGSRAQGSLPESSAHPPSASFGGTGRTRSL